MLIRFKKFLLQSRILTYGHEETQRLMTIVNNMPLKEPHLTEKWDGRQSYREMQHPDLNQSFLSFLSSAVGRVSTAPANLARAYLTDPKVAKSTDLYTFDRAELERLRTDVLAHPEKYELALRAHQKQGKAQFNSNKLAISEKKREEYNYWYSVMNEGYLPEHSLPYYKQFVAYKDFVASLEARAFDTFRVTVQRLINDFETNDAKNAVTEFKQAAKESKQAALRRLLGVINEAQGIDSSLPSPSSATAKPHLTQSARNTKDVKRLINSLVEQDPQISKLIPAGTEGNPLVAKFREEILGDLYQMIEFVLINSGKGQQPSKHLLQERLASLTNPTNT